MGEKGSYEREVLHSRCFLVLFGGGGGGDNLSTTKKGGLGTILEICKKEELLNRGQGTKRNWSSTASKLRLMKNVFTRKKKTIQLWVAGNLREEVPLRQGGGSKRER